jgi:hypothetical protein
VVAEETRIRMVIEIGWLRFMMRISRYTPAVTRVEECTKAEIGVGAAIAAGSQAENGYWALLEIAAIIKKIIIINGKCWFMFRFQFIFIVKIPILKSIAMSPRRFDKIVIVPEAADEKFW